MNFSEVAQMSVAVRSLTGSRTVVLMNQSDTRIWIFGIRTIANEVIRKEGLMMCHFRMAPWRMRRCKRAKSALMYVLNMQPCSLNCRSSVVCSFLIRSRLNELPVLRGCLTEMCQPHVGHIACPLRWCSCRLVKMRVGLGNCWVIHLRLHWKNSSEIFGAVSLKTMELIMLTAVATLIWRNH